MTYADAFNLRTTNVSFNSVADAIDGSFGRAWGGTTAGTATAYTCTPSPAWTSYAAGDVIRFTPHATNTGASTINVNSLGTKNIFWKNRALASGEIRFDTETTAIYDGTQFNLVSAAGVWVDWTPTISAVAPMTVTASTVALAKFRADGDTVDIEINITAITFGGSASNTITFTRPLSVSPTGIGTLCGFVTNNGATTVAISAISGTTFQVYNSTVANYSTAGTTSFALQGTFRIS